MSRDSTPRHLCVLPNLALQDQADAACGGADAGLRLHLRRRHRQQPAKQSSSKEVQDHVPTKRGGTEQPGVAPLGRPAERGHV
jgi:hypothetical protein